MGNKASQKCHCEERSDEAISSFPHKTEIATLWRLRRHRSQ
ncbi:MAG: hypothetical protein QME51_02985 [Planctomycetota bacterium]|nr:hypothetical protein [Planctomycetota bacterium]MDI6787318.1 hypothetical protein [Planctomycetota bacterium]